MVLTVVALGNYHEDGEVAELAVIDHQVRRRAKDVGRSKLAED